MYKQVIAYVFLQTIKQTKMLEDVIIKSVEYEVFPNHIIGCMTLELTIKAEVNGEKFELFDTLHKKSINEEIVINSARSLAYYLLEQKGLML